MMTPIESTTVEQQQPRKQIMVYEAEPTEQRNVDLTCHGCKITLGMLISKKRTVRFCPICGQPAEVTEDSIFVKVPLLRTVRPES